MNKYQRERKKAKRAGTWSPGRTYPDPVQCTGPDCDRMARYRTPQPLCGGHHQQVERGLELRPLIRKRFWKDGLKECRICEEILPPDAFYGRTGRSLSSECKRCTSILNRASRYGLTVEQVELLLQEACAVCHAEVEGRELHIDHDHETGKVRGVLCHRCNTILHEDVTPELLRGLARYLEKNR